MGSPGRRCLVASLSASLLLAVGCKSTSPTNTLRAKPRTTVRPAPAVIKATPTPGATPLTGNQRLQDPGASASPGAVATPTVVLATPTPAPFPDLAVQPVALNPLGSIGLASETENYMILGSAADKKITSVVLRGEDDAALGYRVGNPPGNYRISSQSGDTHAAFQRWQSRLPYDQADRNPRYNLAQTSFPTLDSVLKFWVITSFAGEEYEEVQVDAQVVEVGSHCYVLVDKDDLKSSIKAKALRTKAKEIAATFDTKIYPTDTRIFGSEPNPGIDKDPRVYILLTPAVGNYGGDTTLGYFSQRDQFAPKSNSPAVFQHSNVKEMLYISSRIVMTGSVDDYLGTIAHEFQHMINFNQKVNLGKNTAGDDLWIDEGMAMYAIEANGYGLKAGGQVLSNHVKRFLGEPESFSLTDWDNNPEGIGYGTVYLFMVYLADRFGESIIKEIVTSNKIGLPNMREVLAAHGSSLTRVFHDWTMANLLDSRPQGTPPQYTYSSLEMNGSNGSTRLSGFTTKPLGLPVDKTLTLRPFTANYFRLTDGLLAPRFTVSNQASVKSGTMPRLVLPQDDF